MTLRSRMTCQLITKVIMIGLLLTISNPAFGSTLFAIYESGTTNSNVSVGPGGSFSVDVIAETINAEGSTNANLDSFTYRIGFPNQDFILTSNIFAAPFDNMLAPGGFNGSVPWVGLPLPIDNGVDTGSPGATGLVADLYRTTASTTGVPATGNSVLETLYLLAPIGLGNYPISLTILEAADNMGEFHTASVKSDFNVNVVPLPPAFGFMALGSGILIFLRRRVFTEGKR